MPGLQISHALTGAVLCASLVVSYGLWKTATDNAEQELQKLEVRLEELVNTISRLKEENRSLRNQQDSLVSERANLIEKNEMARNRVEAMINRLKAMEQGV